jgi:hypothetical protein
MSISYLRTWEDADAPNLLRVIGSPLAMLKAVLVDGYGSTPGLGWEFVWENSNTLVLRNQGTRTFVRFYQDQTYRFYIKAYESMSDIDTGLFECPDPANESANNFQCWFTSSGTNMASPNYWMILGDDKGFWLAWSGNAAQYGPTSYYSAIWKFLYIGDYIPYDPANTVYNFCMLQDAHAGSWWYGSWSTSGTIGNTKQHYHIMRPPTMIPGSISVGLHSDFPFSTQGLGACAGDMSRPDDDFQHVSIPELHYEGGLLGRVPGLKNSLTAYGDQGLLLNTLALLNEKKPKLTFDYGDYIVHFFRGNTSSNIGQAIYFVLTEGKGFRNAI